MIFCISTMLVWELLPCTWLENWDEELCRPGLFSIVLLSFLLAMCIFFNEALCKWRNENLRFLIDKGSKLNLKLKMFHLLFLKLFISCLLQMVEHGFWLLRNLQHWMWPVSVSQWNSDWVKSECVEYVWKISAVCQRRSITWPPVCTVLSLLQKVCVCVCECVCMRVWMGWGTMRPLKARWSPGLLTCDPPWSSQCVLTPQ